MKSNPGRNGSPMLGVKYEVTKATRLIITPKADINNILYLFLYKLIDVLAVEVLVGNVTILI